MRRQTFIAHGDSCRSCLTARSWQNTTTGSLWPALRPFQLLQRKDETIWSMVGLSRAVSRQASTMAPSTGRTIILGHRWSCRSISFLGPLKRKRRIQNGTEEAGTSESSLTEKCRCWQFTRRHCQVPEPKNHDLTCTALRKLRKPLHSSFKGAARDHVLSFRSSRLLV